MKKKSNMIPAHKERNGIQIGCKWDARPSLEICFLMPIMLLFLCWIAINIFSSTLFWYIFCAKVSWTQLICMNALSLQANTFQQQWTAPARIRNGQNIPTAFDSSSAADLWKEVLSPAKSGLSNSPLFLSRFLAGFPQPCFFPEQHRGSMSSFYSEYVHFCIVLPAAEGSC